MDTVSQDNYSLRSLLYINCVVSACSLLKLIKHIKQNNHSSLYNIHFLWHVDSIINGN